MNSFRLDFWTSPAGDLEDNDRFAAFALVSPKAGVDDVFDAKVCIVAIESAFVTSLPVFDSKIA
jgi:hypothetical protein